MRDDASGRRRELAVECSEGGVEIGGEIGGVLDHSELIAQAFERRITAFGPAERIPTRKSQPFGNRRIAHFHRARGRRLYSRQSVCCPQP